MAVQHRASLLLLAGLVVLPRLSAVTPFAAGALVVHKANYFDLQNRRIRFMPSSDSTYKIVVSKSHAPARQRAVLMKPGTSFPLPFPFPFGGRKWNEVFVNLNGNLTFGAPDTTAYPERDTWPDGTIRSLSSSLDTRSIEGNLRMISPFWGSNSLEQTRITTSSSSRELIVTWDALRYQSPNEAYSPLGRSLFQVRLGRDGSIEFSFGNVAEKDGVVGIFPGLASEAKTLDSIELQATNNFGIRRAEVTEQGSLIRFALHTAQDIPAKTSGGKLTYRVVVFSVNTAYFLELEVNGNGRRDSARCFLVEASRGTPDDCQIAGLIKASGATITAYLPKIGLLDPQAFSWKAEAMFEAASETTGNLRDVKLGFPMPSGNHFSSAPRASSGSIYEIFHYPFVPKSRQRSLKAIYKKLPAEDDLAIVLTDFRIDDIHNHGSSNGAEAVENNFAIVPEQQLAVYGSKKLQQAAGPTYLGPRFDASPPDSARKWRNYPFAVGWMAHEMSHRWLVSAKWNGADAHALLDSSCRCHWSPFLNTPVVYPVSQLFSDAPYPEESVMGGMTIKTLPDGSKTSAIAPFGAATGYSALDLYFMGMIDAKEVPDAFVISGSKPSPDGQNRGGETVRISIGDIIAASGPRLPAASESQRRFTLGIYLLFEDGREP